MLLVSFVLNVFALLTPLFFQVVMDKVLVYRGLSTLDVIAIGLLGIMILMAAHLRKRDRQTRITAPTAQC